MFDDIPRPTCRSVYTVSDKRLRHGGSGYETNAHAHRITVGVYIVPRALTYKFALIQYSI